MERVDLGSPVLRTSELPYREFAYPVIGRSYLAKPEGTLAVSFGDVLQSRRSRRSFGALSEDKLAELLWHSAKVLSTQPPANSSRWQHRPTPSGGGRHPVDLLLLSNRDEKFRLDLYEPISHALLQIDITDESLARRLLEAINEVLGVGRGTIIWFAAQFDRTLSRYEKGESVVWRDVGALLATISLVAEALCMNCCAVGITGEPMLSQLLNSNGLAVGVGGIVVGARDPKGLGDFIR